MNITIFPSSSSDDEHLGSLQYMAVGKKKKSFNNYPLSVPLASYETILQGRISRTRLLDLTIYASSVLVGIAKLCFKVDFPIYISTSRI